MNHAQKVNPAASSYAPIADYAVVGDGRTLALISRAGDIEWLCLPNLDGRSIFGSLLDAEKGGRFSIRAVDGAAVARRYRDDTNILETDHESANGRFRVVDFMALGGARDLAPEREIVRIVQPLSGEGEGELAFRPAPDYGRMRARIVSRGERAVTFADRGQLHLLRASVPLTVGENGVSARFTVTGREPAVFSLSFSAMAPAVIPRLGDAALTRLKTAETWWCDWISQCAYKGPWRAAVVRSALALKLLQFNLSGAIAAAATTSLPEVIGGERNWDYRFCWLRDAAFTLRAFVDLGFWREGRAFFDWLMHSTRQTQPFLHPLYDVFGRSNVPERTLERLSGYRDSKPVRVGNAAARQFQLDVYGAVVGAAKDFAERGHTLGPFEQRLLRRFGQMVCAKWCEPDNGIWEFRGPRHHHTYSKAMAWSALDDLIWLADHCAMDIPREAFESARAAVREAIMKDGVNHAEGRFKGAFDYDYPDASLLLIARTHLVEAGDPVMAATWKMIDERLRSGPLVYRYPQGGDLLKGNEGAFVICGFWAAEYLARAGRLDEAMEQFDAMLKYANDLGLYSEEVDPGDKTMLGNFPQAFSHTGLINAALAIETAAGRMKEKAA